MLDDYALRYPIGEMLDAIEQPIDYDRCVDSIARFPTDVQALVAGLSNAELAARYRIGSWTIRQLVHHCADSHLHATARVKWALTEENPHVSGYDEQPTAELPDYQLPLAPTLRLLTGLHARLAHLLTAITNVQRQRTYFHLGHGKSFTITQTAAMYDWHSRHHLEHIKLALNNPA